MERGGRIRSAPLLPSFLFDLLCNFTFPLLLSISLARKVRVRVRVYVRAHAQQKISKRRYISRLSLLLQSSTHCFPLFHTWRAPKTPVACGKVVNVSRKIKTNKEFITVARVVLVAVPGPPRKGRTSSRTHNFKIYICIYST